MGDERVSSRSGALALAVGVGVGAVVLAWWPWTDRLDLPKQWMLVVAAGGVAVVALRGGAHRSGRMVLGLGGLLGLGMVAMPSELGARVEGVASWAAAIVLGWAAARSHGPRIQQVLAGVGAMVGGLALAQGLGLDALGGTRAVAGTLGSPAHLGWTLALLVPFVVACPVRLRLPAALLVAAGVVLSGSRTAWVMVLVALPLWALGPQLARVRVALLAGCLVAVTVDGITGRRGLDDRVADLVHDGGTAAGRVYLWRIYTSRPDVWLAGGQGPEGFQRTFPALQRGWLRAHPAHAPFRSDLRHAHADLVEVGTDFGLGGLALLGWVLVGAVRSRAAGEVPTPEARAVIVSAAVGGLTSPVLFFAPSVAIVAVAVGLRQRGRPVGTVPGGIVPLLVVLIVLAVWLTQRVASEVVRSEATWARVSERASGAPAQRATELDPRNPRAWIELALHREANGDAAGACAAWQAAARDLPTDGVLARCQ